MQDSSHPLDPLLRPRSIAIVGVSREPSRQPTMSGSTILSSLVTLGYAGRIDLIHPSGQVIEGRPSYPTLAALPEPSDAVILALPAAAAPQVVLEAGQRGIRGAVVLSAGFSELATEEGIRLGQALESSARQHGVRICGPNGLGFLNVWGRTLAGYFPSLLSGSVPKPGGLSVVTQSGAVGNSLLARAMDRGVGTSFIISSGNETTVSLADYIEFLVEDPHTQVISVYLEGVTDGTRLRQALARAVAAGKPVVVYKVGKSSSGAKAAMSHTAKVAGEHALYRGLFRQLGVIEAMHLDDLVEIPMLLLKAGPLRGTPPNGIGVVSISGGLGAIMADHFSAEGFTLPELTPDTRTQLEALPIQLGSTANPVDTTAAIQRTEGTLSDILAIVARDPQVDAIVFPNAARFPGPAVNVANIMSIAARQIDIPLLSLWYAGHENDEAMSVLHASERVACFDDPAACARALSALRDFRRFAQREPSAWAEAPIDARHRAQQAVSLQGALNEADGKTVLRTYGIPVPQERLATTAEQAVAAAATVGMPVAMKIVSADIPHKAKVGGVCLGLADAGAVARAHADMLNEVRRQLPQARIDGVLITGMQSIQAELLVGAYRDEQYGLVLVVGIGGGQVEEQPDVAMRLLPLTGTDCREALDDLQDRRVRLLPDASKAALAQAIERVAAMVWDLQETLTEIDVNPIALTAQGDVVALDALMTFSPSPKGST